MTYINQSILTSALAQKVASTIYDSDHVGVMVIEDALTETGEANLLQVFKKQQQSFRPAPQIEGIVHQQMNQYYMERERFPDNAELEKTAKDFQAEYQPFYNLLAQTSNFSSNQINSVGIHQYQQDSIGIEPHRDYSSDRNLISIFVLQNEAPFYAGFSRKTTNQRVSAPPKSLLLMRAPRCDAEKDLRPFHAVKGVDNERYSLLLRYRENTDA